MKTELSEEYYENKKEPLTLKEKIQFVIIVPLYVVLMITISIMFN